MAKRKRIEIEDEPEGVSPVSAVVWSAAALAGLLVVYNVFLGQPPDAARMARLALHPTVETAGEKSNQNTIVLRYDPLIEELQRELLGAGYYKGLVDGVNGNRTRDAITAYQRENSLTESGDAGQKLLEHIRFTRKITDASEFTASTKEPGAPLPRNAGIAKLQMALSEMGYEPGEVTGTLNAATNEAIRKFEQQNGLASDGKPDAAMLAELARSTGKSDLLAVTGN